RSSGHAMTAAMVVVAVDALTPRVVVSSTTAGTSRGGGGAGRRTSTRLGHGAFVMSGHRLVGGLVDGDVPGGVDLGPVLHVPAGVDQVVEQVAVPHVRA